jgi:hypothetical protein
MSRLVVDGLHMRALKGGQNGSESGRLRPPRSRPRWLLADRGYDQGKYRRLLRAREIKPVIGRRCTAHGVGLGQLVVLLPDMSHRTAGEQPRSRSRDLFDGAESRALGHRRERVEVRT